MGKAVRLGAAGCMVRVRGPQCVIPSHTSCLQALSQKVRRVKVKVEGGGCDCAYIIISVTR